MDNDIVEEIVYMQDPADEDNRLFNSEKVNYGKERKEKKGMMDKAKTVENLIRSTTVSMYIGNGYWTAKQRNLGKDADFEKRFKDAKSGDEICKVLVPHKLAILDLGPGQEAELDMTKRYYNEVFLNHPISHVLDVENLDKPASEADLPDSDIDLSRMDNNELEDLCRLHNLAILGKSKKSLIKDLQGRGIGVPMKEEEKEELQKDLDLDTMKSRINSFDYKTLQKKAKEFGLPHIAKTKEDLRSLILDKLSSHGSK